MNWPTLARFQRYERSKQSNLGGGDELEVRGYMLDEYAYK